MASKTFQTKEGSKILVADVVAVLSSEVGQPLTRSVVENAVKRLFPTVQKGLQKPPGLRTGGVDRRGKLYPEQ